MSHEPGQRPSATRTIFERDIQYNTNPVLPAAADPVLVMRGSVFDTTFLLAVEGLAYRDGIVHCAVYSGSRYTAVNVEDPDNPFVVGSVQSPGSGPFQGSLGGSVEVILKDDYAILAAYNFGNITSVDFSDLANPQIVSTIGGTATPLFHARGIARGTHANSNFAFVSADQSPDGRFLAINISDPTSLGIASWITHPTFLDLCWHVAVNEDSTVAYVVTNFNSARVTCIDISDPFNMSFLGSVQLTPLGPGWGCAYRDGYVYAGVVQGVAIVDVSDPTAPTMVSSTSNINTVFGVTTLRSNYILACYPSNDRLTCWNVSDPTAATSGWSGSALTDTLRLNGARDVIVNPNGQFAYVAAYDGHRLTVVGIT